MTFCNFNRAIVVLAYYLKRFTFYKSNSGLKFFHGYTVQYFVRMQCNKLRCMRTKKS